MRWLSTMRCRSTGLHLSRRSTASRRRAHRHLDRGDELAADSAFVRPVSIGAPVTNGKSPDCPSARCGSASPNGRSVLRTWPAASTARPSRRALRSHAAPARRNGAGRFGKVRRGVEIGRIGEEARHRLALAELLVDHHRERARGLAQSALEARPFAVVGAADDPQRRDESRKKYRQGQQDQPKTQRQFASLKQELPKPRRIRERLLEAPDAGIRQALTSPRMSAEIPPPTTHAPDSRYAVLRLLATLALMTIGSSGMYVVAVVLPAVQAEFGVARADASLPYTLTMIGFGVGGMLMGRLADRFGVMVPLLIGAAGRGSASPARRWRRHMLDLRPRARPADRAARQLGDVRAAGRRHLAVVRAAARHRGRDLRERQLSRRRDLAADRAALHRGVRLAPRPTSASASSASLTHGCRSRCCMRRAAAARCAAPDRERDARRSRRTGRSGCRPTRAQALLVRRRRRLLRGDVDAAGAHRRLLRRPRLRRGARRARCCR